MLESADPPYRIRYGGSLVSDLSSCLDTADGLYQFRFQEPGTRYQVPTTKYQVPGTKYQIELVLARAGNNQNEQKQSNTIPESSSNIDPF